MLFVIRICARAAFEIMVNLLENLSLGLGSALMPGNLVWCFVGCLIGTVVGVLPGLGPTAALAILLPLVVQLGDPIAAIIMMAGVYYGTQYGGSTTSILMRLPGEAASAPTTLDGYALTQKGHAKTALAVAAIGSFIAGSIATLILALVAPGLAALSLKFGPAEYFSIMLLALVLSTLFSDRGFVTGLALISTGILLGSIGTDINSGTVRFTVGVTDLSSGIPLVVMIMGLFGLPELIQNLSSKLHDRVQQETLDLDRKLLIQSTPAIARGTLIGTLLGVLPGIGSVLPAFAAYAVEKKLDLRVGSGEIKGVAAPESANNAAAQISFVPMLSLGLPSTPVMALMAAALIMQGITPGPQIIQAQPLLFWTLIVSMWVGNVMLLILNLPLIGMWTKLLSIPAKILYPLILVLCCIGVYSVRNNLFDVLLLIPATAVGFWLQKRRLSAMPLLMGFVLGPMMEEYLRRSLIISQGDWSTFLTHPLSAVIISITVMLLFFNWKGKR